MALPCLSLVTLWSVWIEGERGEVEQIRLDLVQLIFCQLYFISSPSPRYPNRPLFFPLYNLPLLVLVVLDFCPKPFAKGLENCFCASMFLHVAQSIDV